MEEFEIFNVKPFVSHLLGMGDRSGFIDNIHEVAPTDQQPELFQKFSEGSFTLWLDLSSEELAISVVQFFSMLPRFSAELMSKELDGTSPKLMNECSTLHTVRGSDRSVGDVTEMPEEYKCFAKMCGEMKGRFKISKKGEMSALSRNMNARHMSKVLPPQMPNPSVACRTS
ncbi:signal recognition particle 54 kDa protein [Musa troglodytarum]|uniref:Signal recognition particle 54 kDa protein n=1 Tax=Musa troglodytarum TaxID=320322 RepID=A0A9E7H901_9LILI|nr:signal recognition particle 54 kDa protein [Musa troglodytarum]